MRPIYFIVMLAGIFLLFSSAGWAQTHFSYTASTGNNAQIAIPLSINPYIGNLPMAAGDEIGVFTPAGLCVGAAVWDGVSTQVITVWADNTFTPAIDGIVAGEAMSFRVWRQSINREYRAVAAYSSSPPATVYNATYAINGLYVLTSLGVPVTAPVSYVVISSNDTVVAGSSVTIMAWGIDSNDFVVKTAGRIITWSKTGTGGNFATPTSTTDTAGIATVLFTTHTVTGTIHTVRATDAGAATGTSSSIVTITGPAAQYRVTSSDLNPIAGSSITINAQLTDLNGNPVSTAGKTVSWSMTGSGGSFSSLTSTTNAGGLASVTFYTSATAGAYNTVTGTDGDAMTGTSDTITTVPGSPTHYHVLSSNSTPDAGTVVTITAQLMDVNDNPVPTIGKIVTWTKTGMGGSFSTATSTTNASGTALVTFTTYSVAGTVHTVTGTDTDALTGTSNSITTVIGPAAKYLVTAESYTPAARSAIIITAQLSDAFNNFVETAGRTVTWGTTGTGGSFSSGMSTTNTYGIATVSFTTRTEAGTAYTVTGTDNNGLSGTTDTITTRPGTAVKYLVTSTSDTAVAGSAVTITAQLADVNNNHASIAGKSVTWSKTGTGGTFANPTSATNTSGVATVVFTTSTTTGIIHVVTATDNTALTGSSGSIRTTPPAPQLVSPLPGQENVPINDPWIWRKVVGALSYTLQISSDSSFASFTVNRSGIRDTVTTVDGLSNSASYYWRVNARDTMATGAFSLKQRFTTIIAVPDIPELVSPSDLSLKVPRSPTLLWRRPARASKYGLQVALDQACTQLVVSDTSLVDTAKSVGPLGNDTTYYWRVRGLNAGGPGGFSSVRSFTIVKAIPLPPVLISPAGSTTDIPVNPVLRWRKSAGADTYSVQVSLFTTFTPVLYTISSLSDTTYSLTSLHYSTAYSWRVGAWNDGGQSEFSAANRFTTLAASQSPPHPPKFPGDDTTDVPVNPTLTWNSIPGAVAYRVQVSLNRGFEPSVVDSSGITDTTITLPLLLYNTKYYCRVCAIFTSGEGGFSDPTGFTTEPTNSVGAFAGIVPKEFALRQNYPNPFNPVTTIEFSLEEDGKVVLKVFDILGHEVATLVDSDMKAGMLYQTRFDGSQLSTGLYLYRLESGKNVLVKKLLLMK